jgi:hypothetical protein
MQYLTQMLRKVDIVVEVDELLQEREEAAAGAESLGSLELPQVWGLPPSFLTRFIYAKPEDPHAVRLSCDRDQCVLESWLALGCAGYAQLQVAAVALVLTKDSIVVRVQH